MLLSSVPDDLSPEERQELETIRRRKQELLHDIKVTTHTHTFLFLQSVCETKFIRVQLPPSSNFLDKNAFSTGRYEREFVFVLAVNPVAAWPVATLFLFNISFFLNDRFTVFTK